MRGDGLPDQSTIQYREVIIMSITAAVVAIVLNLAWVVIMMLGQKFDQGFWPLPARGSIIPGTNQRFIYAQDFWVMTWGDMLALSLVAVAFGQLAAMGAISLNQYCVLVIIASIDAVLFAKMCLASSHKPDQGYPKPGQISFNGLLHLPYHGLFVGISVVTLYHLLWTGMLRGIPMWIGLAGAAIYIAAFIADIKAGNFDPIKRIG